MALWLVLAAVMASLAPPALGADAHDLCRQQAFASEAGMPATPSPSDDPGASHQPLCSACTGCTVCNHGAAHAGTSGMGPLAAPATAGPGRPEAPSARHSHGAALQSARGPPAPAA